MNIENDDKRKKKERERRWLARTCVIGIKNEKDKAISINLTRVRTAFRGRGILGMAAFTTLAARDIMWLC